MSASCPELSAADRTDSAGPLKGPAGGCPGVRPLPAPHDPPRWGGRAESVNDEVGTTDRRIHGRIRRATC